MPDDDQDEWPNGADNCPTVANPEQRDRDRDGIGDTCDTCPSTPNAGQSGEPGQGDCDVVTEAEPNDAEGNGEPISLVAAGRILEVRGTIEPPSESGQAYDRYQVMVAARTMLRVRVARAKPESLLEPAIVATGGSYTSPRIADGLFVAERELYFSAAGTYEIAVTDRRGLIDGTPKGSRDDAYALSIRAVEYVPEGVTPPFRLQPFTLAAGQVGVYQADLAAAPRNRIELETDLGLGETDRGLDTILAFETNDGADVFENDDLANGYVDSRLVLPLETSGRVRVIVDHHRALALDGDDDPFEVRMTIDQPASNEELEPNDLRELASTLVFPGETAAGIGPVRNGAPDVDWYRVTANAGQIVSFRVLIPPASQIDPAMAIGKAGTEEFEPMYLNYDSSGISSRIDVIFPEAGAYDLIVIDQNNVEEPFHGGPLFTYRVFGEVTGIQPISILTSTGALSGTLDPGGRILRHVVAPREASLVAIEGTAGSRDFDPMVRVYGPSAVGLLGEGLYGAFAYLPAAGSYVVGVSNGNDGSGSTEHTYDLTATLYPLTASAEAEPNDTSMEATPIELTPANVITGELAAVTDLDRVRVTLAAGSTLDALLSIGGRGRTVSVYAAGDPMPLDSAAFGVYGVAIPADGDYEVEVSGTTAGPYTLGLRVR